MGNRGFFVAILMGVLATFSMSDRVIAQTQPWERVLDKLYQAAKKEGEVTLNSGNEERGLGGKEGIAKFNKRFPGIKINLISLARPQSIAKIVLETRTRKVTTADAVWEDSGFVKEYVDRDLAAKMNPAELTDQPEKRRFVYDLKLPVVSHIVNTFVYNTKLVAKSEIPKRYEDLLDPKWKGKLALDGRGPNGFTHLPLVWGKEKFWDFIKALPAQKPLWDARCSGTEDRVTTGEAYIGCTTSGLLERQQRGEPVEFLLLNPVLIRTLVLVPIKHAPHPNAAKLVAAWLISPEGVESVGKTGYGLTIQGSPFFEKLKVMGAEFFYDDELNTDQLQSLQKTRGEIAKTWGVLK